jgi:hypothetical protein
VRPIADGRSSSPRHQKSSRVIGSGLRCSSARGIPLIETPSSGRCRRRSREARCSPSSSSTLRDRARKPIDGFVAGSSLAAMVGTLDGPLRSDITVSTEIAPDLGAFNAGRRRHHRCGAECPSFRWRGPGGLSRSSPRMGRACPRRASRRPNVVLQERPGQRPTSLGLHQIQRFAEGRGSALGIESERCASTLVRLFLPRTGSWASQLYRRYGDRAHALTERRRISRRQPSNGCTDLVAGAKTRRPVQRCSS